MKRSFKIACISALSIFTLSAVTVATIAWFSSLTSVSFGDKDSPKVRAGMETFPYESGSGTENDPYIITRRNHLYNLAWKQYLGHYNINASTQQENIQRCYFKLEADIDMSGITLPPIGTDTFPFYGFFDGDGHTVSNLTITNDNPKQDGVTEFGIAKPSNSVIPEYAVPSEIVGFFGVVGNLPGQTVSYSNHSPSVENVVLDNLTIRSETEETLLGLAAGYLDGTLNNVRVGSSEIDIQNCKPITSITNNLSDYSLVGYCATTNTISDFTKTISEKTHREKSGGQDGGFGASVNFKDYLTWFYDMHKNKSYDTSGGKPSDIGYLSYTGFTDANITRYNSKTSSDGNYYLRYNLPVASTMSDPEAAFTCTISSAPASGNYYNYSFSFYSTSTSGNYTGYYREYRYDGTYEQAFTATTTTAGSRWHLTFASPVSRFSNYTNFDLHKTSSSGTTTYAVKTGTSGGTSSNRLVNLNFAYADAHVFHLTNDSYIPLKFSNDHSSVPSDNTGYIVGVGLASNTNYVGGASPRIASYSVSYLNNSVSNGEVTNVYTVDTSGTKQSITETKVDGVVTSTSPSYERYVSSRAVVGETFSDADVSNGIHFDVSASTKYSNSSYYRGSIANDSSDTYAEHTMLLKSYNGVAKTTRMPKGSIDFELQDSGYITFYAGMYNVTSSVSQLNFFSLHHVIRTSPTSYTLKEIERIYKSTTWTEDHPNYVYDYADGSSSAGTKSGGVIFDVAESLWAPRAKDNSLYYFEIPVNQGEYAMGSVDSSHTNDTAYQGAYLIYLDIGSNGRSLGNNTMDAFYTETTSESDIYPQGVDFNVTGLSAVGGNTGCLAIQYTSGSVEGAVTFIVDTVVAIDSEIGNCNINYKANNTILNVSGSTETIGDITSTFGEGKRIIIASIEFTTGSNWTIEYQEKLDGSGGTYTKIFEDSTDHTSEGVSAVPGIFTENLAAIKAAAMAVQLDFTGTDFSITNATYSGATVSLTIPTSELGSTELNVTFGTNYSSLNINGSPYPAS